MAKHNSSSTQIDRDNERFTQYAIQCRTLAHIYGVQVPTYTPPCEVAVIMATHVQPDPLRFTLQPRFALPTPPKLNGQYEGDKGTRYHGPSKRTLKRRASRAQRSA